MIATLKNFANGKEDPKNYCFKMMDRYFMGKYLSSLYSINLISFGSSTFYAKKNSTF